MLEDEIHNKSNEEYCSAYIGTMLLIPYITITDAS